ncbi:hypothetical protein N9O60_01770 [Gammaproteobacteria bacterium]|nr:hypothetical protein [Gammaproteobacteria bacterium]
MSNQKQNNPSTRANENYLIMYRSQNDDLIVTDTDYLDSIGDQDPILELAIELMVAGYPGIVVHTAPLSNGDYFFGINTKRGTPEARVYARAEAEFFQYGKNPDIPAALREIEAEYAQLGGGQNDD